MKNIKLLCTHLLVSRYKITWMSFTIYNDVHFAMVNVQSLAPIGPMTIKTITNHRRETTLDGIYLYTYIFIAQNSKDLSPSWNPIVMEPPTQQLQFFDSNTTPP